MKSSFEKTEFWFDLQFVLFEFNADKKFRQRELTMFIFFHLRDFFSQHLLYVLLHNSRMRELMKNPEKS